MVIISYRHNFIFIKTQKVAGTSVEAFLRGFCGEDDIITPVGPLDEQFMVALGCPARNYSLDKGIENEYTDVVSHGKLEEGLQIRSRMKKSTIFSDHATISQIKKKVNEEFFDKAYKFSIDRHPYSWLASIVGFNVKKYQLNQLDKPDFQQVMEKIKQKISKGNFGTINRDRYTEKNRTAVDTIMKFENLESDLYGVLARVGLNNSYSKIQLPKLKVVQSATPERVARSVTDFEKGIIFQKFRKVFEELQYDPYVGFYSNEVLNGQLKLNENSEKLRLIQKELSNW